MNPSDIVICGLPRSGSTLTCELLNKAPNTVALDEPMDAQPWTGTPPRPKRTGLARRLLGPRQKQEGRFEPAYFLNEIDAFFTQTRASLLRGEGAPSKVVGGQVSGSKFVDERSGSGLREQLTRIGVVEVDKDLSPDFVLAVKHNAGFAATLEHLAGRYRCFAIIRNPLAMLASWQTVSIPIHNGRVRRAEKVDPGLRALLDRTEDVLDRQFILLNWFFDRFRTHLPSEAAVRYEDIVSSGGRTLEVIAPGAAELDEPLSSRNKAAVYDPEAMQTLGRRLLETDGSWWDYYTREDVSALLEVT